MNELVGCRSDTWLRVRAFVYVCVCVLHCFVQVSDTLAHSLGRVT